MERGAHEDLSEVLDQAIIGFGAGERLEECLDTYPEFASELDPLLRTAAALQAEAATPLPPEMAAWLDTGARDFAAIAEQMLAPASKSRRAPVHRASRRGARHATSDFSTILDDALGQVRNGTSVEDCLASYPQHARELAPLLHTGGLLRAQAAVPLPADLEAWLPTGARDFAAIVEQMAPRSKQQRSAALQYVTWQRAVAALVVAVTLMGTDTVAAASLPGQPLYTWKRAKEDLTLTLALDSTARFQLHADYANRRLRELSQLAAGSDSVDPASVAEASQSLFDHLAQAIEQAGADPAALSQAQALIDQSENVLEQTKPDLVEKAPDAAAALDQTQQQVARLDTQLSMPVAIEPTSTATSDVSTAAIPTSSTTPNPTTTPTREPGSSVAAGFLAGAS